MRLFINYCVYFIKHKIDVFKTYRRIDHLTVRDFLHENSTLSFKEYQEKYTAIQLAVMR